ncbi:MAG: hypothetical protein QM723_18460 [Myxococcaceae bacterium]
MGQLTRREFVVWTSFTATTIGTQVRAATPDAPYHEETISRAEDMLWLQVRVTNFRPHWGNLVRIDESKPAYLIVAFPAQHVLERAFFTATGGDESLALPLARSDRRVGNPGDTRLVFLIDKDTTRLQHNLHDLMAWGLDDPRFQLVAPPIPQTHFIPRAPADMTAPLPETAIEVPLYVSLQPTNNSRFRHVIETAPTGGRQSVWQTWLELTPPRPGEASPETTPKLWAIWSSDYVEDDVDLTKPAPVTLPYINSGTPAQVGNDPANISKENRRVRKELVDRTCNSGRRVGNFDPAKLSADTLVLSSVGAWLKARGEWQLRSGGGDLEGWRLTTTGGRDQDAQVMDAVYLFPFGHRASAVSETTRRFELYGSPPVVPLPVAPLRQRNFILIKERLRAYSTRALPHTEIQFLDATSPDLDQNPRYINAGPLGSNSVYAPLVGGKHCMFRIRVTDHAGKTHDFELPLLVVKNSVIKLLQNKSACDALSAEYDKVVREAFQKEYPNYNPITKEDWGIPTGFVVVPPRPVAFAPVGNLPRPPQVGNSEPSPEPDATLELRGISYGADARLEEPYFLPRMLRARVAHPGMQRAFSQPLEFWIQYDQNYVNDNFNNTAKVGGGLGVFANVAEVVPPFFRLGQGANTNPRASLQFVNPDMHIRSLSALTGLSPFAPGHLAGATVPSFADLFTAGANPGEIANILGGIKLSDILKPLKLDELTAAATQGHLPQLTVSPDGGTVRYRFCTDRLKPKDKLFTPGDKCRICVTSTLSTNLINGETHSLTTIDMSDFTLELLGLLTVEIKSVSSTRRDNQAPTVQVETGKIGFKGALDFLAKMAAAVTGSPVRSPIEVSTEAISYKHRIALPPIEGGGFSISNVAFVLGLDVPLNGGPMGMTFAFASRQNPFLLTVSAFGGGGYLEVLVLTDPRESKGIKIQRVEGAFEFGGRLALDLGVARGDAYLMAGFYFRFDGGEGATLGGFLRCGGALDVLGLITICAEFYMSLDYIEQRKELYGHASLTYSIDICFVSVSVTLEVSRRFSLDHSGTQSSLLDSTEGQRLAELEQYLAAFA